MRSTTRTSVFGCLAFGVAFGPQAFVDCGGAALPYVDDAGVYREADGAVIFTPGSACVGWDASHVHDPPPSCTKNPDPVCEAWITARTPPGSPINDTLCFITQLAEPGVCSATWELGSMTVLPNCPSADPVGDEFCLAWASQFFVHNEHARIRCILVNDAAGLHCWPGAPGTDQNDYPCFGEDSPGMFVDFGEGGAGCELPCSP